MSTKKIECHVSNGMVLTSTLEEGMKITNAGKAAAILVIGEGDTPPKVFTEEEVKAMLQEVMSTTQLATHGQFGVNIVTGIAKRHGITL